MDIFTSISSANLADYLSQHAGTFALSRAGYFLLMLPKIKLETEWLVVQSPPPHPGLSEKLGSTSEVPGSPSLPSLKD